MKRISISVMWVLILSFLVLSPIAYGSSLGNIKFTHITTEDGLSHHEVLFVLQDTQGFMWFGTKQGLNKYDGMSITPYFHDHDSKDSNSITGNFVHWIHEDQAGVLWIATWGNGISRYDPKFDKFTNYYHIKNNPQSIAGNNVWSLFMDSNGFVWAATDEGLSKLNPETGTFVHYRHDSKNPNSLSHNTVSRIREDAQGIFWISTYGGGLNRFDPKTEIFTNYKHHQDDPKSLSNDNLWCVFIDSRNRIWTGSEKGLNRFNKKTGTFTSYQHDKTDPNSLSSNTITFIYEDHAGTLWLGTFGGGLNLFDLERETFVHYRHNPQDPHSLSNDIIMSIYEDTTGSIWVGTYGGVDKYDPGEYQFEHYNTALNNSKGLNNSKVRSIFQDSKGSIWIGTGGGGLNQLNKARNSFVHFLHDDNDQTSIGDNDIWAIDQDKRGDLWIATHGAGLNRFNPEQKTFSRYKHDPNDINTPACNPLYDLKVDKKRDVLWIAAYLSGLDKFDIVNKKFTHYRYNPDNSDGIVSNWSTSVFIDSKGFVWVGTEAGLSLFNPATELFTNFKYIVNDPKSLSANMIQAIFEDSRNIIWIGTGDGLNRYEEETHSFKKYSKKDGLAGNNVAGITEDNKGHLWISTDKGLSKFNPQKETFRNYNRYDGLQGNRFIMHSAYSNESGELFFGGSNGFNVLNPSELRDNQHVPRVVFTDLMRFNKPVPIGKDSVLTQHINQSQQISLGYDYYAFRIEFTALNYRNSQKNQYAYMMEGFDKDFTYTDSNHRSATYTNLDPGHYTFHVKGSNNDGVWNEEGKSIKIIILAPWWETLWFRGTIFMLVVGFIFGVMRFRTHSIQQLNRQLEMQVKDRTVKLQNELKERKHAENALRIEKDNLNNIFESMRDGVYIVNQQYDIEFVNQALKNEFGIYEGKKCYEYLRDSQEVCPFCKNPEVFSGKTVHWEWSSLINKRIYDLISTPVKNPDGSLSKLAMFRDITETKQAEKVLQESEAKYREFVDGTEDLVTRVDNKGNFIFANHTAEKLFGIKSDDCAGLSSFDFIHPDDKERTMQAFAEWGEKKLKSHIFENRQIDFAGKTRNFTWTFNIHYETDGTVKYINSIAKDITVIKQIQKDLQKAKNKAENANKAKSEFLANMSHEIRTPLNAINGFSELLIPLVTDKKQKHYLKSIRTAGKSLLSLINDILDLSKIEADKMQIQYAPVNILVIFDEIKQIFNKPLTDKSIEFSMDIDKNIQHLLLLDEIRLRQILLNIVGNAIKFTKDGYIRLMVKQTCSKNNKRKIDLEISVKDTGIGIAKADQDKIFNIFEQQDGQSTRAFGGTGLGLSISKRLAKMMNGQIKVASKVNEGSTFTILLRDVEVSTVKIAAVAEETDDTDNMVFEKAKILVVDDIRSNREFLSEALDQANLNVQTAENGQEAILLAREYQPDIIIMDIKMPVLDGFEAAKYLKKDPETKQIPVIILSASPNVEYKTELSKIGIDSVLSKPVTKNKLFNELAKHIGYTTNNIIDIVQLEPDYPLIDVENSPELVKILKDDILPFCESLKNSGVMNDIKIFGNRVKELGKKFNARILIRYGEDINESAQNYDLADIEISLKTIAAMIKKLD